MSTTLSCGQCGAPLRAEQGWCSLCYASVEPAFDPLTAPLHEVVGRSDVPEGSAGVLVPEQDGFHDPTVPVVKTEAIPVDATRELAQDDNSRLPVSDVDVMLSMLAAEHRQNDPASGLAEHFGDKSTRMMVMFGGMFAIGLVGFLLLTVLGAIF